MERTQAMPLQARQPLGLLSLLSSSSPRAGDQHKGGAKSTPNHADNADDVINNADAAGDDDKADTKVLCRREQAVVKEPAGAARGRNLRDAILKKEQVLHDDDDDITKHYSPQD